MLDLSKKRKLKFEFKNIEGDIFKYEGTVTAKLLDIKAKIMLDGMINDNLNNMELTFNMRTELIKEFFGEAFNTYETKAKNSRELLDATLFSKLTKEIDKLDESLEEENQKDQKEGKQE